METVVLNKRRKNIDLPTDTLQKLSILAASQGKSLKSFIEKILIEKAAKVKIEVSENPSPSGDTWFDNPKNMEGLKESMEQARRGEFAVTLNSNEDIRKYLGL
jgi:macrodomain Ter protein organizer (MatP/YcbG family)